MMAERGKVEDEKEEEEKERCDDENKVARALDPQVGMGIVNYDGEHDDAGNHDDER